MSEKSLAATEETNFTPPYTESQTYGTNLELDNMAAEELFLQHELQVAGAVASIVGQDQEDGGDEDISWHTTEVAGKQQPVYMVNFAFQGGSTLPAVIRPTWRNFKDYYEQYPIIRESFPRLYMSTTLPYSQGTNRNVLVIEKIEGYHGDHQKNPTKDEFNEIVSTPEGFDQLCDDTFQNIDKILAEPLKLNDVSPPDGHNVIYNTATCHFQLFDVDTVLPSEDSHVQKFIDLVEESLSGRTPEPLNIAFAFNMIQRYLDAHPDTELTYASEPRRRGEYFISDTADLSKGEILSPGSREYDNAYSQLIGNGLGVPNDLPSKDYPILGMLVKVGKNVSRIDPEMLKAIQAHDIDKFGELTASVFRSRSKKLTVTEFVELEAA